MVTLTSDKFTLVKADFSIRESIHQEPERSTPQLMARPEGFTPTRKVV
jgi:hypothetical protein